MRRKRKKGQRRTKAVFVLACEDSKSAPSYFRALFRLYSDRVTLNIAKRHANKTSPEQVVERAIDCRSEKGPSEENDQTWAIFDAEPQAVNAHAGHIRDARKLAHEKNVSVAVSNPCIEHWFRLHFEDADGAHGSSKETVKAFSKTWEKQHGSEYDKGRPDIKRVVNVDSVENAVRRAEAQHKRKKGAFPECCSPCVTDVYLVVRAIQKLPT